MYEVETKFENYSRTQKNELLNRIIKKYSETGAHTVEDTDGDYEIIIWTEEGATEHEAFNSGQIVPREVKGIIVFENDGDDLVLRYIDALNKTSHFLKEDDDL